MRFAFRCYFRNFEIFGLENIPKKGPVLFLCNHPCSFTEPMLLACFQPRILNFLVRGDIFENKLLKPILESTHQIPIYRARDGFENLRKNKSTFDRVYQKLISHESVLIFPESTTQCVRYLRPLQKGAAHMALGTVKDHCMDNLLVIPCGVNFNNVLKSGQDFQIHIGKAININSWLIKQADTVDLPSELTKLFTEEMNKVVLSVPSTISPELYNELSVLTFKRSDSQQVRQEKHLQLVNGIQLHPEIISDLTNYSGKKLNTEATEFFASYTVPEKIKVATKILVQLFMGISSLLVFGLPLYYIKIFTNRFIKAKEYKPPIRILFSITIILFLLIFIFTINILQFGFLLSSIIILGLLISLYSALRFLYSYPLLKYLFSHPKEKSDLIKLKNLILSKINK
ncbi:MAG: 1-acyl-sn-glycerol-3-phosphate acyltransferase [Saprospiraceae bacterium]|nr:1-acyl-sn-glycerol-3-phosphate acyltransferase [Saprospiraceae bacterium]